MKRTIVIILLLTVILSLSETFGQTTDSLKVHDEYRTPYVFWAGTNPKMTLQELASYCAPIFWLSPDEPLLNRKKGKDIRIPEPYPFEEKSDSPVVYYQLRLVGVKRGATYSAFYRDGKDISKSIIDLNKVSGLQLEYIHYYNSEAGAGEHKYDTEQVQFKIYVNKEPLGDSTFYYELLFSKVTAKAHALEWYDNIYLIDTSNIQHELQLPFYILVEEGKHASCTDMNGDGYYTPGYDVNIRVNDAWGVRDIIRTGSLISPFFLQWMQKVRKPEHRIYPPLPEDSYHRIKYTEDGIYAPDNAIYKLRPFPSSRKALPNVALKNDMETYEEPGWPIVVEDSKLYQVYEWRVEDMFIKSFSLALRFDDDIDNIGIALSFPLLIFENVEVPLIGGWLVNRMYFQDYQLRDFGYNVLYTNSASRFLDPYLSLGFEIDSYDNPETQELESQTDFVLEAGLKFRANVRFSPLKFLSFISDFWGVRLGIKNKGITEIKKINYVFEFGLGVW